MSLLLFSNFGSTQLAGSITNVQTTANLLSGAGSLFPSPTNGQYFVLEFNDQATGLLYEIVHVTNVTGDTITMTRAQEGTTALNWSAGDLAFSAPTAGQQSAFQQALSFAGNPNGSVAGTAAQGTTLPTMCWNSTNGSLYVCTTTGSTSTSVWTPIAGPDSISIGSHIVASPGSFSWTVPAGVYILRSLTAFGGAGGGGGAPSGGSASGGSSGATGIKAAIPVIPGQVITGTVGAGGSGGASSGANGSAGGDTTITIGGTTYTAPHGPGGLWSSTASANSPAQSAAPTNFDVGTSYIGAQGNFGFTGTGGTESGQGGSAVLGGIGGVGGGGTPAAGGSPGGGGGGGGPGFAGAAGAAGAVYFDY